jgi:hypothetical protein
MEGTAGSTYHRSAGDHFSTTRRDVIYRYERAFVDNCVPVGQSLQLEQVVPRRPAGSSCARRRPFGQPASQLDQNWQDAYLTWKFSD